MHKVKQQRHFRLTRLSVLVCLIALLFSCTPAQEAPLRIGTNVWPGYEPLYLARSLGHYDSTSIKLVELTSASDVIHALRNGMLEGAALTLDEALLLLDDGFNHKVILVFDFSNGGDALLAKPEITQLSDIRGKRVAVEESAVGAVLLDSALNSVNLSVSDIIVTSCTSDEHLNCYEKNDAVVTFDPARSHILNEGANLLFDSSQIPNKIVDVLVVSEKTLESHPDSLKALLAGYFKARQHMTARPLESAKLMSKRLQLTPEEVIEALKTIRLPLLSENHRLLTGLNAPITKTANELSQAMYKRKLLKKALIIENLSNPNFLPKEQL